MSSLRQVVLGILAALCSTAIILGGLSLAMTEGVRIVALAPTFTSTPRPPAFPSATLPAGVPTPAITASPSPSLTPTVYCPAPAGWVIITTKEGDTFESLAQDYQTTVEELAAGNCTAPVRFGPGYRMAVPGMPATLTPTETSLPTETETAVPTEAEPACGPPAGWVIYRVRSGDTLFHLSQVLGITLDQLRMANCLFGTSNIRAGQELWVPFLPVYTPEPTETPGPTATPKPSKTPVPPPPTELPPSDTPAPPPTTDPPVATEPPAPTPSQVIATLPPPPDSTATGP